MRKKWCKDLSVKVDMQLAVQSDRIIDSSDDDGFHRQC